VEGCSRDREHEHAGRSEKAERSDRQDRGLGSMLGGGAAFASQLDAELLAQIRARYGGPIAFHFLPMPSLLRRSGSFGTHWMLQQTITICTEVDCGSQRPWYERVFRYVTGEDRMEVTGDEVIEALRALDQPAPPAPSSNVEELRKRIAEERDQLHAVSWRRLASCLTAPRGACP